MNEKHYNTKEVAEILNISDRTVRRYLNTYFSFENNAFKVSTKMLDILKNEHLEQDADIIVQEFTKEEYNEFYKRLSEYPILKNYINSILNELEYHKASSKSHQRQMELVLQSIHQRNFIEAKEKK